MARKDRHSMRNTIKYSLHISINLLLVCCVLLSAHETAAQSQDKPVQIKWGDYEGYATYEYTVNGKDTILDGDFEFNGPILDTFTAVQRTYFSMKGHFSKNKPADDWQFNRTNVSGLNKTTFNENFLRINTVAKKHQISGSFNSNKASANWRHDIISIADGQNAGTIFTAEIQERKDNNKLLSIESSDCQLSGRINKTNLADSTWKWLQKNDTTYVQWQFEKGLLIKVSNEEKSWSVDDKKETLAASKINTVPLNQEYIDVLTLKLGLVDDNISNKVCISVLNTLDSLEKVRKEFFETLNQSYSTPLTFRLPYFELSDSETIKLDSIASFYALMDSLFGEVYGIKEPALFKKNFPEVVPLLDTINLLYSIEFKAVEKINSLNNSGVISYFNRDRLARYVLSKNQPLNTAQRDSLFNLQTFINHNKLALLQLKGLKERIMTLNDIRQKQKSLLALEKKMLDKNEIFKIAIDSALLVTPQKYTDGLNAIQSFRDSLTQQYWRAPSALEKLIIAEKNLTCFDNLLALTHLMYKQPEEERKITQLYTESAFNLFTSTDIEYVAKKRIVSAYSERLIPYFYNTLLPEISCENVTTAYSIISKSALRMQELKEEETQEIEKKLTKRLSNSEILSVLGVTQDLEK